MSTRGALEYFDPRTLADPYAYYESRRSEGPVLDVSTADKETYLVIDAAVIREIVGRPDVFSSRPVAAQGVNFYPRAEALLVVQCLQSVGARSDRDHSEPGADQDPLQRHADPAFVIHHQHLWQSLHRCFLDPPDLPVDGARNTPS